MNLNCPLCNVEVSPPQGGVWVDRAELGCQKCASTVLVRREKSPVGELTWLELLVDGPTETARVARWELEDALAFRLAEEVEARDKALDVAMAAHGLGRGQKLVFRSLDQLTTMGGIQRVDGKLEVFGYTDAGMRTALEEWCAQGLNELVGQSMGHYMRHTKPDAPQFLTRLFWYSTRALPIDSQLSLYGLDRRGLQYVLECGEGCPEVTLEHHWDVTELRQRARKP